MKIASSDLTLATQSISKFEQIYPRELAFDYFLQGLYLKWPIFFPPKSQYHLPFGQLRVGHFNRCINFMTSLSHITGVRKNQKLRYFLRELVDSPDLIFITLFTSDILYQINDVDRRFTLIHISDIDVINSQNSFLQFFSFSVNT